MTELSPLPNAVPHAPVVHEHIHRARWVAVVIFAIALSTGLLLLSLGNRINSTKAQVISNHAATIAACVQGNTLRQTEIKLWTALFDSSLAQIKMQNPSQVPQAEAELKTYLALVNKAYAPVDCSTR